MGGKGVSCCTGGPYGPAGNHAIDCVRGIAADTLAERCSRESVNPEHDPWECVVCFGIQINKAKRASS